MTCASRQSDTSARLAANAETVIVGARSKSDAGAPRLQLAGAPESPRAVIRIDRPGTYRIASDVVGAPGTVGILIAADHVTLDLAGFSVVGKPGSLSGIRVMGARTNVTVRNGSIRGWGGEGVEMFDATESRVEGLRVAENARDGVRLGANGGATEVDAWGNGRDGIVAGDGGVLRGCVARSNAGVGVRAGDGAVVDGCVATSNGHDGILAGAAAVVRECVSRHNHAAGIAVGDMGAVRSCELIRNDAAGIRAGADAVVTDNRCVTPTPASAIVVGPGAAVRDNFVPGAERAA